jgi:prepilin-type N-terminal cleavage/methylation domain-containing protein
MLFQSLKKKEKGFTLIEMLIAVSVMTIGIVGVYALVPQIISVTASNTDKLIASQLAREGMELVRNIRDTNWLKNANWDAGLTGCIGGCEMDYNDSALSFFAGRKLKIDANGFYNYESGNESKFVRKITITPSSDTLTVKVEISWEGKYSPYSVTEKLYNWR